MLVYIGTRIHIHDFQVSTVTGATESEGTYKIFWNISSIAQLPGVGNIGPQTNLGDCCHADLLSRSSIAEYFGYLAILYFF